MQYNETSDGGQGEHVDDVHSFIRTQKSLNLKNTNKYPQGINNNKGKGINTQEKAEIPETLKRYKKYN